MSFEAKKFSQIFEDMRQNTSIVTDFEVGSVVRTMYESFAYELAVLYKKMDLVYLSAFVDTAQGVQLEQVVSVLGIQRNLPDFAEGIVTFDRDKGNEDLVIPLGTLVATEDTEENPKKVYQTIEQKILPKDQTTIDVKIQAIDRGIEWNSEAETIVVMPRPIPGIKSVINTDRILLLGKQKETDEELRQRAKNALISSGKATTISIENAVLSLPGILDVKVKENENFAEGVVIFTKDSPDSSPTIPSGLLLSLNEKEYKTIRKGVFPPETTSLEVPIQATKEGKFGEQTITDPATTQNGQLLILNADIIIIADENLNAAITASLSIPNFGVIEVYVDGPNIGDRLSVVRETIDKVRAAGIYVLLEEAPKQRLEGLFQLKIQPGLQPTPEEKIALEQQVANAITDVMLQLKMGHPLVITKLIKEILNIEEVDDIENFELELVTFEETGEGENIEIEEKHQLVYTTLDQEPPFSNPKQIYVEDIERIAVNGIFVAFEEKELAIHLTARTNNINEEILGNIRSTAVTYLEDLNRYPLNKSFFIQHLNNSSAEINLSSNVSGSQITFSGGLRPPLKQQQNGQTVYDITFGDRPTLGELFIYQHQLFITGALRIFLSSAILSVEKAEIIKKVVQAVQNYLETLKADEDVLFETLKQKALEADSRIDAIELNPSDFIVFQNNDDTNLEDRLSDEKINIEPFEKAELRVLNFNVPIEVVPDNARPIGFFVTDKTENLNIEVTTLNIEHPAFTGNNSNTEQSNFRTQLRTNIIHSTNIFMNNLDADSNLDYNEFLEVLNNAIPTADYSIAALNLQAESVDGGLQFANLLERRKIYIRSVEKIAWKGLTNEDIIISLEPQ